MIVRFADHGDVTAISALLEDMDMKLPGVEYTSFSHPCFVAEVDGKVVGMLSVLLGHPLSVIMEMAVAPEWQHRGIGKELMQAMEAVVKAMGYPTLVGCIRVDRALNDSIKAWPGVESTGMGTLWMKRL